MTNIDEMSENPDLGLGFAPAPERRLYSKRRFGRHGRAVTLPVLAPRRT